MPVSGDEFLVDWERKFHAKEHDLTNPEELDLFIKAANDIIRSLAHRGKSGTLYTVKDASGVPTLFVQVTR